MPSSSPRFCAVSSAVPASTSCDRTGRARPARPARPATGQSRAAHRGPRHRHRRTTRCGRADRVLNALLGLVVGRPALRARHRLRRTQGSPQHLHRPLIPQHLNWPALNPHRPVSLDHRLRNWTAGDVVSGPLRPVPGPGSSNTWVRPGLVPDWRSRGARRTVGRLRRRRQR